MKDFFISLKVFLKTKHKTWTKRCPNSGSVASFARSCLYRRVFWTLKPYWTSLERPGIDFCVYWGSPLESQNGSEIVRTSLEPLSSEPDGLWQALLSDFGRFLEGLEPSSGGFAGGFGLFSRAPKTGFKKI